MKKFLLSFAVLASSAIYVLYQYFGNASASPQAPVPIAIQQTSAPLAYNQTTPASVQTLPQQTAANSNLPAAPAKTVPAPTPIPAPKPKGQYNDGTYTGTPADAYYGTVQIQATVSGGKLANVTFLQYPSDRSTSRYINSQAMPYLTQEALQVQSANVDIVSGATDTSMAFQQSLGDALGQAKN